MMVLVIGGSGSGKSAYAEERLVSLSGETGSFPQKKYYIATMQCFDEESRKRIERHRMLRSGKGFCTIEQPVDISQALGKMEAGKKTALLECVSNLAANEMFAGKTPQKGADVVGKIVGGIAALQEELDHLVVVSNTVFEDGRIYDAGTMEYLRTLGEINRRLAALADQVVEVVAGIPVVLKAEDRKEREAGCIF